MDIVGYTKLDADGQFGVRKHFYAAVDNELATYSKEDIITLDAGDGMAICYLGDPEDMLLTALSLKERFGNIESSDSSHPYEVRMGINLGPVKIAELQGEKRVIGDAINVANRIMGFAGPNQLYVSRSYFEVVSHVSKEYLKLFDFLGVREDKHVRKHEVYAVSSGKKQEENSDRAESLSPMQDQVESVAVEPAQESIVPAKVTPSFDEEILSQLAHQLSQYIGPMGSIIVKKKAQKADTLNDLCGMLSEEIDDQADKIAFVAACKNIV
ncbi:MAG: adenylate/guanylate cyclase domain-containing protein [Cellvibrionaceae bacterium]